MKNLLNKIQINIMVKNPFFSRLLFTKKLIEDNHIPTACTNGQLIRANTQFLSSLNFVHAVSVILHELLHIILLHPFRLNGRNKEVWNYACDYEVNLLLYDNDFPLPDCALLDFKFRGMSAEKIYEILIQHNNNYGHIPFLVKQGFSCVQANEDEIIDLGDFEIVNLPQYEIDRLINTIRGEVFAAYMAAKNAGNIPGNIIERFDLIQHSIVNWKAFLANYLNEFGYLTYDFFRPDKRYLYYNVILPSLKPKPAGNFCIAVDVSGSMSNELIQKFIGETFAIAKLNNNNITILPFDTTVYQPIEMNETTQTIEIKGRGGTDFKAPVQYISDNYLRPTCLIYLSDGICDSFPYEPDYPVLWVTTKPDFEPPFGEYLYYNEMNASPNHIAA